MRRLHHIAIAVKELGHLPEKYTAGLGIEGMDIEEVPSQGVMRAMGRLDNGASIEFIAPTSEKSPISKFIEKNGSGIHHFCIETDDLEKAIEEAREAGFRTIGDEPSDIGHGMQAIFLHPSGTGGVLIELVSSRTV